MLWFKAVAVRWVSDEPQPGMIEISVLDAYGREHRIFEKDIVTPSPLTKDAQFPIDLWIEAESRDSDEGRARVTLPWNMATTESETELTLSRELLLP